MSNASPTKDNARSLQTKLQMLRRHHDIDDDAYRYRLKEITGQPSSKGLSANQLVAVLNSYAKQGIYPPSKPSKRNADKPKVKQELKPLISKIEALLAEKGRVEGRYISWEYARGILKTMGGPEKIEWADATQLSGVITALIQDAKRHGRELG